MALIRVEISSFPAVPKNKAQNFVYLTALHDKNYSINYSRNYNILSNSIK